MSQKTALLLDSIHIDGKEILQKHYDAIEIGGSQRDTKRSATKAYR